MRALTPEQYAAQQAAYAPLEERVRGLDKPTVMVMIDGESAHVQIHVPGTEEVEQLRLTGQKALWALSLYLAELDRMLQAAQAEKTADANS